MNKYKIFLFIFSVQCITSSYADEIKKPVSFSQLTTPCQIEVRNLCPTVDDKKALLICLKEAREKISPNCKNEMSRLFQANQQMSQRGGGAMSGFGGFSMTPVSSPNISYEGRLISDKHIPDITENKLNFATPIYREGVHSTSLSTQAGILHINQHLQLSNGTTLPLNFYRTELGANYMEMLPEKKALGVRTSFGYNTDKPFLNERDLTFSLTSYYSFPSKDHSSWILSLYLSNNGQFANYIPLPGVLYLYRTPTFTGMFGFPLISMQWTPVIPWTYSLTLFGLNISAEAAYGTIENQQYLVGFSFNKQSFMLHDRVDEKERLNFLEKKIFVGLRTSLFNILVGEFQIGDAFGRRIYLGNKSFGPEIGALKLNSSGYISLMMKMSF